MSIEDERKYVIDKFPDNFSLPKPIEIKQHYIAVTPKIEVRVRRQNNPNDQTKYTLGIKSGNYQQKRPEETIEITKEKFSNLKELSIGSIEKNRYVVGGLEIDVFQDTDLILLEIENSYLNPPDWVGEEVTGQKEYYNSHIATNQTE